LEVDSPVTSVHFNVKVAVLEFAYKLKVALDSLKKILDTCGTYMWYNEK